MERIPFVTMNNGNVKIIVPAQGIFIDTFWHYMENMGRTFKSYANTLQLRCNFPRMIRTIIDRAARM